MAKVKIKKCPKCGGMEFFVMAHVTQLWKVDMKENFENVVEDAVDVTHRPDDDDMWECAACEYYEAGSAFNTLVDESEIRPKDREYYLEKYRKNWDRCEIEARKKNPDDVTEETDGMFWQTADAAELAGYYIHNYGDDALEEINSPLRDANFLKSKIQDVVKILEPLLDSDS